MGLETHRAVKPYIAIHKFQADPDVPIFIRISEVMLLMPIFRQRDCGWQDATGEYDLCLDETMEQAQFISRMPGRETFAYRFVSSFFPQSAFKG